MSHTYKEYKVTFYNCCFIALGKKIEEENVEDNNQDKTNIGNNTKLNEENDNIIIDENHPDSINFKIESDEELFLEEITKPQTTFKGLASSSEESQPENSDKDIKKEHLTDEFNIKNDNIMLASDSKTSCSDSSENVDDVSKVS